jgi:predicted TIM-barrel fold metal-dependent hydrolase
MKTIDFHTHIFPDKFINKRNELVHEDLSFSILYSSPEARLVNAETLIESMDENCVDISVAVGFPWKSEELFRQHNDCLLEAQAKYPERIRAFVCFDLSSEESADEFERCVKNGASGAGELAFYSDEPDDFAIENIRAVMKISEENRLPVLVHSNEPVGHFYPGKSSFTPAPAYNFAKQFPENRIVFAHWGGGLFFYSLMKREVSDVMKNVYVDTAASPFLYRPEIYEIAVRLFGADRILFGSDYPLIKPSRYFDEMKKSGISEEGIMKIKGMNAIKLLFP